MTDVESIQRLFAKAIGSDSFSRLGPRRGVWDISRGCEDPLPVTKFSRATGLAKNIANGRRPTMIEIVLLTPCRRCGTCLRKHAWHWSGRAATETERASRTWFGTLTCSPERHFWIDRACSTRQWDFAGRSQQQQFAERAQVLGIEVTKYLKRIRKNSGCQIRYLSVCEIHDGKDTSADMRGRPHIHMLVHEYAGQPVQKALLDASWKWGFSRWRLVKGNREAAWYVTKYVSKSMDVRVRASIGYGV